MKKRTKAILIDILGVLIILAAIPIGWLPGPGGIPLIILGLSLLANNHEWAERWMDKVKDEAEKAAKRITESSPTTKWAIDIFAVISLAASIYLIHRSTKASVLAWSVSFAIMGVTLLATNQERHIKLWNKLRNKHKQ